MNLLDRLLSRRSAAAIRYGVAIVCVALATMLRWLLDPFLNDHIPFITFFLAIAAWFGGMRPAVLAAVLGLVVAWLVFIPPRFSVAIERQADLIGLVIYFIVSLGIAGLGGAMRTAEQRAAEQRELLHVTLVSIGDGIITTDTSGNVVFLNPVAQQLTG
jgi:K+-sensing histidine kinase KdpD